jgi:hypothetical protein
MNVENKVLHFEEPLTHCKIKECKMIGQQNNTYLAVGLAAAAAVAVVAGSPLAASVAAGSVELAEQVPVTAVTGWAWQMSAAAAAAAAVELVAVAEDRYHIKPPKKATFSLRQLQRKLHAQASKVVTIEGKQIAQTVSQTTEHMSVQVWTTHQLLSLLLLLFRLLQDLLL